jgi:multicomponent Na+:H+ antiporter subunit C
MQTVLALVIGGLFAAGLYMILRRSMVKVILGLFLLSHAANLLIFTVGRVTQGKPPFIPLGEQAPVETVADPLTQALILTAIVIGFGVQAFAIVLFKRAYQTIQTDDLDCLKTNEEQCTT